MNHTQRLAELATEVDYDHLPAEVQTLAHGIVLDSVATIVAGSQTPAATDVVLPYLLRLNSQGSCTVIGHRMRVSPAYAAFANGLFGHILDFEILQRPPTHPSSPVLPALYAVSEVAPVSGKDALSAIVAAFEVMARIATAVVDTGPDWLRIHPPGLYGPFGAATAVGRALRLSPSQMTTAYGVAGSRVCGLTANTGTHTKATHCGNAARAGFESAVFAASGASASDDIFGARGGLGATYYEGKLDTSLLVEGFGEPFAMIANGINVKKYPCQYVNHWPIDAVVELGAKVALDPTQIESVQILVGPDNPALHQPPPKDPISAKFSMQFTVSAALIDGTVSLGTFQDSQIERSDIRALMSKIELCVDPDICTMDYATNRTTVTVSMKSGEQYVQPCEQPLGSFARPIPWDRWVEKFRMCMALKFDDEQIETILADVESFEDIPDVGAFIGRLASLTDDVSGH